VLRRLLLAVLFCVAAWVMADRTSADADSPARAADATTASVGANIGATVATPPIDTHPPEARWESLLPPGIGAGSSRGRERQTQAQAAVDLPDAFSRVPWPAVERVHADPHAARSRPPHLHDTPLLI
jgi:hypothetical protein